MRYATKADWALAQAQEHEAAARGVAADRLARPLQPLAYARSLQTQRRLEGEAARFRLLARRLASRCA